MKLRKFLAVLMTFMFLLNIMPGLGAGAALKSAGSNTSPGIETSQTPAAAGTTPDAIDTTPAAIDTTHEAIDTTQGAIDTTPPAIAANDFITRDGDKLIDSDNKDFRFISANTPTLVEVEDSYWHLATPWEQTDALKSVSQMGGTVARIYPLSVKSVNDEPGIKRAVLAPNSFDEDTFVALDNAIAIAHQNDVRLIIPFVDSYAYHGGIAEYSAFEGKSKDQFWTNPSVINDFKETINYVLNRTNTVTGVKYKDDPAILAWETGNELAPPHAWTADIASYIKSIDTNHLVLDGKYGIDTLSLTDNNIDMVSDHFYPEKSDYVATVNSDRELSKDKKPLIIGEFGFKDPTALGNMFNSIISNGTTGALIWSLRFQNEAGGFYAHTEGLNGGILYCAYRYPGFPSGDSYYETATLNLLKTKAYEIRGLAVPAAPIPDAPLLKDIASTSNITWRGSTGASSYDVYRKTDTNGTWDKIASDFSFTLADPQYFDDTTAVTGTSYYYKVVAKNASGSSADSNTIGPVVASHSIIDNISSGAKYIEWGKFYDHSADLDFDRSNAAAYGGDISRLKKLPTSDTQYVTYAIPTATCDTTPISFEVDGYIPTTDAAAFKIYASSDDTTYTQITNLTTIPEAGTKVVYSGTNIPAGTRFIKVEFPGPESANAELGKVTIVYPTDGSPLTFPMLKTGQLINNGILIDEMNNLMKMSAHTGNLGFDSGDDYGYFKGDTKRLTEGTNTEETFTYAAGAQMNYFKMTTFEKQDPAYLVPDFQVYTSTDGVTFTPYLNPEIKRLNGDGWWQKEDYTGYILPTGTKYLKFKFPLLNAANNGNTWMAQVSRLEIGVGDATIPPPITDKRTNKIDDFEGYSGDNANLNTALTYNAWGAAGGLTLDSTHKNDGTYGLKFNAQLDTKGPNNGSGWGGFDKVLDAPDWSGNSGVQFWLDPVGQAMHIKLQFTDKTDASWKYDYYTHSTDTAGMVKIPFSDFVHNDSKTNPSIDLSAMKSFGIYTDGSGSHTVYIDSIGLYKLPEIDKFETYSNDAALNSAYTRNSGGDNVTLSLDASHKNGGNYGLKFDYSVAANGYAGVTKTLGGADWSDKNGIQFWYIPDNSNNSMAIQFKTKDGTYWESYVAIKGTTPTMVSIPFSSFIPKTPSVDMDRSSVSEFSIYVNKGANGADGGTLYFDSFETTKITKINDFENYKGNNGLLQAMYPSNQWGDNVTLTLDNANKNDGEYSMKFSYTLTDANGWGGVETPDNGMNHVQWNVGNALQFWCKPDGQNRGIKIQLKDKDNEVYSSRVVLSGNSGQLITIPLSAFAYNSLVNNNGTMSNGVLDLDNIKTFGIYIDKANNPAGSGDIYFDSFKIVNIPELDSFDYYSGRELISQGSYARNVWGNSLTVTPESTCTDAGSKYAAAFAYTMGDGSTGNANFTGVTKTLSGADWTGYNALQFWLKPDDSHNTLTIQFKEASGEVWETYYALDGTDARTVTIPFGDFNYAPWYSPDLKANGKVDIDSVTEYSFYINGATGGRLGASTFYLDSIKIVHSPVIDDFDGYNYSKVQNQYVQGAYVANQWGSPIDVKLDQTNKTSGPNSLKLSYNITSGNWGGVEKDFQAQDWRIYSDGNTAAAQGISFMLKSDTNTGHGVKFQIKDAKGNYWAYTVLTTGTDWKQFKIPFSSFTGPNGAVMDLSAVSNFGLYIDTHNNYVPGTLYIDDISLYAPASAQDIANGITTIGTIAQDVTTLTLPTVPVGFTIAIKSVTGSVIATDGTITPPSADTQVTLVFTVTRTSDNTTADTASIVVTVPARTQTMKVEPINVPTSFKLGSDAKVSIKVTNQFATAKDATLIIALFDNNGAFVTYGAVSQTVDANKSVTLKGMMKLPASGHYTVKCFVWDSFEGMNPLSDSIIIPVSVN